MRRRVRRGKGEGERGSGEETGLPAGRAFFGASFVDTAVALLLATLLATTLLRLVCTRERSTEADERPASEVAAKAEEEDAWRA